MSKSPLCTVSSRRSHIQNTASEEQVTFNEPHAPHANAIEAFNIILPTIKKEVIQSRHDWNKHEPKMWSRAHGLSDHQLTAFTAEKDLVLIRSGPTSYGTILLGKFQIPDFQDDLGKGYIHVRYASRIA